MNVIIDPAAAFRDISPSSPWGLAFAAIVALRFASLFVFYRPAVTPTKLVGGVAFQIATIAPFLAAAALLIWLVAKVWRTGLRWPSAVSITAHVGVAHTLATIAAASVAGALLPASVDVDLRSPPFTNLGWLVGDSAGRVTHTLLAEVDVRAVYAIVLVWLGLRGAAPAVPRALITKVVATLVAVRLAAVVGAGILR